MSEFFKEWLSSADMDIQLIEKILDDESLTPAACFHAQQCVEKSLKAIIEKDGDYIPKTHDLVTLYGIIEAKHDFKLDFKMLQKVGELYIETRYPGDFGLLPEGLPSLEDSAEFYRFAKLVYNKVKALLSE